MRYHRGIIGYILAGTGVLNYGLMRRNLTTRGNFTTRGKGKGERISASKIGNT